jgi:hypothetical protein
MNESIGSVSLYNIIIAFLAITFAFLAGAVSYSKAFRVNTRIVQAIETYEGYNEQAITDINRQLNNLGYRQKPLGEYYSCPMKGDMQAKQTTVDAIYSNYVYCVYEFPDGNDRYHYGVLTYIYIDIPIIGDLLEIPIYSISDSYYRFPTEFPKLD